MYDIIALIFENEQGKNEKMKETAYMSLVEIRNEELSVTVDTKGAEIVSIRNTGGKEFIWCGDPDVWAWHAPLLFPICGELDGGRYTYNGREYFMKRHGFARDMEFRAMKSENAALAEFSLSSHEETLKVYPFEFMLRVIYELCGKKLTIKYIVENRTVGDMYFSIGSHEGYACPEGIEMYSVFIDEIVPLVYKYFEGDRDTLVYEVPEFTSAVLKRINDSSYVTVDFGEVSSFSIWTKPGGKFICLEPWHGIPETAGAEPDISKKPGYIRLGEGEVFKTSHTITF